MKYPRDGVKAISNRIAEYPDVLTVSGEVLHCKICKKVISLACMYVFIMLPLYLTKYTRL